MDDSDSRARTLAYAALSDDCPGSLFTWEGSVQCVRQCGLLRFHICQHTHCLSFLWNVRSSDCDRRRRLSPLCGDPVWSYTRGGPAVAPGLADDRNLPGNSSRLLPAKTLVLVGIRTRDRWFASGLYWAVIHRTDIAS